MICTFRRYGGETTIGEIGCIPSCGMAISDSSGLYVVSAVTFTNNECIVGLRKLNFISRSLRKTLTYVESILTLPNNWDGEGSPACSKATLDRTILFVTNHVKWLYEKLHIVLDVPDIGPGPNGTIDIHWRTTRYELLVNIPASVEEPATYYGDDYASSIIQGSVDPTELCKAF